MIILAIMWAIKYCNTLLKSSVPIYVPKICFARIGGEEFVILLWDTKPSKAQFIAERIRELVAKTPMYQPDGSPLSITVSLGITHQHAPLSQDLQQLINTADQALYQAKHLGRNQVVLAS